MWVSTVFVSVKYSQPQASRSRSSRETTLPALFMRLANSSNSRGVRSISPLLPDAVWASSSSVMPLAVMAWLAPGKSPPEPRRKRARTRAMSSRTPKGLAR